MKLNFDPNQEFQLQAIQAIVDLFEGQPLGSDDLEFSLAQQGSLLFNESGFCNNLVLSAEQLLQYLRAVQARNEVPPSDQLDGLNFSVEMETGTGKTYVYLRTIYELNQRYGFKKFVIVVPSIAIREGVLKNLEITYDHFQTLYAKTPASYMVYDAKRVSDLRGFAASNTLQILVINIDSFAKDANIINKSNDKLTGQKPIEFIQATQPIVIVDEPQNMETDLRRKAIANLRPTCTLRYSATHKHVYNLLYQLNPVKAYDLGLVKQIEVDSIYAEHSHNQAFISLESFHSTKTKVTAKITIEAHTPKGVTRKSVTVNVGDDLYLLSQQREIYKDGYLITGLDARSECIELANGDMIFRGETRGGLQDEIMKVQMQKAIEEHFKKEKRYQAKGIKVLSLFFIDRVANYRHYDEQGQPLSGKFAAWFEQIYTELTRSTLLEILQQCTRLPEVLKNPQLFLDTVVKEIQQVLHQLMIDGIKYTKIGDQTYTMEVFESEEIEHYLDNLYQVTQAGKTIANYLVIDLMSTPEREFAEDCENNEEVEFYFKLPRRFKIDTPIGPYTPDWALILKNEQKLFFVAETKSTLDRAARRDPENMKIDCGRAHFTEFEAVEFRDVTKLSDLAS